MSLIKEVKYIHWGDLYGKNVKWNQATGRLHLGNYIGAISQFVKYQDEYEMYIFIANQHAITVPTDPKALRQNTKDLIALYLAAGLDPENVHYFTEWCGCPR